MLGVSSRAKQLQTKRYYTEKAAYMRRLAKEAQTEALRKSCLTQADVYEALAKKVEEQTSDRD